MANNNQYTIYIRSTAVADISTTTPIFTAATSSAMADVSALVASG